MKNKSNETVVIVITVHKTTPNIFETISLRQVFKILGRYHIKIVCPQKVDMAAYREIIPTAQIDRINPRWMCSKHMFNKMKMHPLLYEKYRNYKYILFYEPDAFVFRDELEFWCQRGFDYIGAPWFSGFSNPKNDSMVGVGNGGFSLRKVSSHLKALHTFSLLTPPKKLIADFRKIKFSQKTRRLARIFLSLAGIGNNSHYFLNGFNGHDDIFWGFLIKEKFNWFKVADFHEALKFSFEVKPETLFAWNQMKLPFGCHAWSRYDLEFWRPFIEQEGYCF